MGNVTLGLSIHQPEMIPMMVEQMRKHDAIILEEPPSPEFKKMLGGIISIEDYLDSLDLEFPEFNRRMCSLLRNYHYEGKIICQVEPFLELLLEIHDFFADGNNVDDLERNSIQYLVYLAERNATGALLSFYQTVMTGTFGQAVEAVMQFARKDAERFRLRDALRAQALVSIIEKYTSVYIEAGLIHYPLWQMLRQQMQKSSRLQLMFLADDPLKQFRIKGHLYGPGDQLTLMNIFHPNLRQAERETLLAARSLIYSKMITKNELTHDLDGLPHVRNELECIEMVRGLKLEDCQYLFPLIRKAGTAQAYKLVSVYLSDSK